MCGASHVAPTGDLARNPGLCSDWESDQRAFCSQPALNPLSHPSQGEPVLIMLWTEHRLSSIDKVVVFLENLGYIRIMQKNKKKSGVLIHKTGLGLRHR